MTGPVLLGRRAYQGADPLRQTRAPMRWAEEDPEGQAAPREKGVEPAKRSPQAEKKACTPRPANGDQAKN